ncbi:MAG: hypothetical protein AAB303_00715, partial [Chloroflexota bacterium]
MTFPLRVLTVTVNWGAIAAILVAILLVLPLMIVGYRSLRGRICFCRYVYYLYLGHIWTGKVFLGNKSDFRKGA